MSNLESKRNVLENRYNTDEYYQRCLEEINIYQEVVNKYNSADEYVKHKLNAGVYSEISSSFREAFLKNDYERMIRTLDDHKNHVKKWEKGYRMRLDDGGKIEYYIPENT